MMVPWQQQLMPQTYGALCPHPSESSLREDLWCFPWPQHPHDLAPATWLASCHTILLLAHWSPPTMAYLLLEHSHVFTPCKWLFLIYLPALAPFLGSWWCQLFLTRVSVQMSLPEFPLLEVVLPLRTARKTGAAITTSVWRHQRATKAARNCSSKKERRSRVSLAPGTACPQRHMQILNVEAESLKNWAEFSTQQETMGFIMPFICGI